MLDQTSSAVVFTRRTTNTVWACRRKSGIYRLPAARDGFVQQRERRTTGPDRVNPQIAGRFIGFVVSVVEDYQPGLRPSL